MAIVEMKRIELLAPLEDEKKLMRAMQRLGCVEVSPFSEEDAGEFADSGAEAADMQSLLPRISWLIGQMNSYTPQKAPFLGSLPEADADDVVWVEAHQEELLACLSRGEELERAAGDAKSQLARLQTQLDQLADWEKLDIPVELLGQLRDVRQWVGTVERSGLSRLQAEAESLPVVLEEISQVRENSCVWLAAHISVQEQINALLKDGGFTPAHFQQSSGTVAQQMDGLRAEIKSVQAQQRSISDEWKTMSQQLTRVKIWYDLLQIDRDRAAAQKRTAGTGHAFLLRGWVPAEAAPQVEARIHELSPVSTIEIRDPLPEEEPPVALRNITPVVPFESVIEGFAMPAYRSMDPTITMAPFYALLFGMMLSDAGYGLLMAIAIPLLIRLKQPGKSSRKTLGLLFFSGIATILCGAVYDTWFGFNFMKDVLHMQPLLDPIGNPMPVMLVCMGIGVIHLFAGLACGMYLNVKRGKPWDAVFDQLSWILLISGLLMLVAGGAVGEIGKWIAIAGVAILLLFAGRDKKNPFKRLLGGLGALYGATSWISDILSYMRLFGMGLATGVIGMVINMLVQMMMSNGILGMVLGAVIFVGAHAFNLGINALGAYVHACRLQYIEFFGKFYEEGGNAFRPLGANTRYVLFPHF